MHHRARDLMTPHPLTIAADTPVLEVQHLFVVANIGGAPIVDSASKVVGILSGTDLLRISDQVHDDEIDPQPMSSSGGAREQLEALVASDVGTSDVIWVSPDTPASQVARLMRDVGIHRVLVGDNGKLEGILTAFDLLRAVEGIQDDRVDPDRP
ncbi:MAG: CBS domain-containing protein [Deltaproteobacteria bacterium]